MRDWSSGVVFYEIEIMLDSDSGRDKHTEIVEQGAWLSIPIKQALTSVPLEGVGFGRLRYWGDGLQTSGEPIQDTDIGGYVEPLTEEALRTLRGVVADLARLVRESGSESQLHPGLRQVVQWAHGEIGWRAFDREDLRGAFLDPAE